MFSDLIHRYVAVPLYIRWGNYYYEWDYLHNVGFTQVLTKCSFTACVKLFIRTIHAKQSQNVQSKASLIAETDDIRWLTSDKLMHATFFYRVLWVCERNFVGIPFCSI